MKKIVSLLVAVALVTAFAAMFAGCSDKAIVLNVYNWGEYISDGYDDTLDVNKAFEEWYYNKYGVKVTVNYTTYKSNEEMYTRISSGSANYDVIIPSDYMIERLIAEDLLYKLDWSNIPSFSTNISEGYKSLYYDPHNEYSVPYAYGVVGIIYDANRVDAADVTGWELMWNTKYAGKILQFDNSRDGFATAQCLLGIDLNTTDVSEWERAFQKLKEQTPIVQAYAMDTIFDLMESGEAAIGAYYVGDYFTMVDNQSDKVDLQFYQPDRSNVYVDAFCVPKCSQNKAIAEAYIEFMLSEEPAVANAEYTYYASPNKLVYENAKYKEDLGDAYDLLYPEDYNFAEAYAQNCFKNLSPELLAKITELWSKVKQ